MRGGRMALWKKRAEPSCREKEPEEGSQERKPVGAAVAEGNRRLEMTGCCGR